MTFKLDLTRFAKKAGDNANQVVNKVALEVLKSVVEKSPVDTGRFRGNWNFAYGNIDYSTKDSSDKSGGSAIARAALSFNTSGQDIFITNNLPYAQRLENGYSNQAPTGMVRITVVEFRTYIKNAVRELK